MKLTEIAEALEKLRNAQTTFESRLEALPKRNESIVQILSLAIILVTLIFGASHIYGIFVIRETQTEVLRIDTAFRTSADKITLSSLSNYVNDLINEDSYNSNKYWSIKQAVEIMTDISGKSNSLPDQTHYTAYYERSLIYLLWEISKLPEKDIQSDSMKALVYSLNLFDTRFRIYCRASVRTFSSDQVNRYQQAKSHLIQYIGANGNIYAALKRKPEDFLSCVLQP